MSVELIGADLYNRLARLAHELDDVVFRLVLSSWCDAERWVCAIQPSPQLYCSGYEVCV